MKQPNMKQLNESEVQAIYDYYHECRENGDVFDSIDKVSKKFNMTIVETRQFLGFSVDE